MENNKNVILFIFEGKKTEPFIVENLKKYFLNENENTIVEVIYGTVIYHLYKKLYTDEILDEDIDFFKVLQENCIESEVLKDLSSSHVSEIYLFFDYDGHASNASDDKLLLMLEYFNNETENGKLYISYPMVEAFRHLSEAVNFNDLKIAIGDCTRYKALDAEQCDDKYKHLHLYNTSHWMDILEKHSKKVNYLLNDIDELLDDGVDQNSIFNHQLEHYINVDKTISVLGVFPIFLLDYYGYKKVFS